MPRTFTQWLLGKEEVYGDPNATPRHLTQPSHSTHYADDTPRYVDPAAPDFEQPPPQLYYVPPTPEAIRNRIAPIPRLTAYGMHTKSHAEIAKWLAQYAAHPEWPRNADHYGYPASGCICRGCKMDGYRGDDKHTGFY